MGFESYQQRRILGEGLYPRCNLDFFLLDWFSSTLAFFFSGSLSKHTLTHSKRFFTNEEEMRGNPHLIWCSLLGQHNPWTKISIPKILSPIPQIINLIRFQIVPVLQHKCKIYRYTIKPTPILAYWLMVHCKGGYGWRDLIEFHYYVRSKQKDASKRKVKDNITQT